MSDKKRQKRIGRPPRHGFHAIVYHDELLKQYPELVKYVRECHDDLVHDLAPEGIDTLPVAKRIILERAVSKIQMTGLLDIFLGRHGILRRDRLDSKVLEAEPIVQTWLQLNSAILRDLQALGLEAKKLEPRMMTPAELLEAAAADDAEGQANQSGEGEIVQPGASVSDFSTDEDQNEADEGDIEAADGDGAGEDQ